MTDKTKYKNQNGKQDTAIQCNTAQCDTPTATTMAQNAKTGQRED